MKTFPAVTEIGSAVVRATQLIGTSTVILSAWEPTGSNDLFGAKSHSTISSLGGLFGEKFFGQVGTERLPADLAALPRGAERIEKVTAFQKAREAEAIDLILSAFPEIAFFGVRDGDEIIVAGEVR